MFTRQYHKFHKYRTTTDSEENQRRGAHRCDKQANKQAKYTTAGNGTQTQAKGNKTRRMNLAPDMAAQRPAIVSRY